MCGRGPPVPVVNWRTIPLAIAAVIFILDRATKVWIERTVEEWQTISVIPGLFNLVHAKNKGAAFSMFAEGDSQIRTLLLIGVSLGVLVFISYLLLKPGKGGFAATRLTTLALALIMGGALGNVYDRIAYGQVTDFLEVYQGDWRFAAFNVADSAISVGAGLLILDMWRTRKHTDVPQAH